MLIKRREILKAIRTERLGRGEFITMDHAWNGTYTTYSEAMHKGCKVCAVGAVLRLKGVVSTEIENYAFDLIGDTYNNPINYNGDEFTHLDNRNYLAALSTKFERLSLKYRSGKRTREKLARFVKRYFPKQFRVG